METYQVLITEKAEADMENLYNYIAADNLAPEAAMAQYNRIASQILALSEMPARIRVMDSEPEHTLKVRKMSVDEYYVLFQIRESQVIILRVLHCKQDIEGKLLE
ncbi:MAG: type II toxin-antitoxin system RelE/ParE family toxin [Lachnospiraceae bacterium]|nr:type II toxin-antitoxin system RelE/ParE family toxin [Lachnospiraceae bacterium]